MAHGQHAHGRAHGRCVASYNDRHGRDSWYGNPSSHTKHDVGDKEPPKPVRVNKGKDSSGSHNPTQDDEDPLVEAIRQKPHWRLQKTGGEHSQHD